MKNILLIGAGNEGSYLAYTLAKLKMYNITVVDYDIVEEHNLESQFYKPTQIGMYKVDALKELISDLTGETINTINCKCNPTNVNEWYQMNTDIVVLQVDSLEARVQIVNAIREFEVPIIDLRSGGLVSRWYILKNQADIEEYLQESFKNSEIAGSTACGIRNLSHIQNYRSFMTAHILYNFDTINYSVIRSNWSNENAQETRFIRESRTEIHV